MTAWNIDSYYTGDTLPIIHQGTYFRAFSENGTILTQLHNIKFILKCLLYSYLALRSSSSELFRKLTGSAWITVQFTCDEDSLGKSQNNCRRYLLLTNYGQVIQNFWATEWEPKSGKFPVVWKSAVFKWHSRSGFWYLKQSVQ